MRRIKSLQVFSLASERSYSMNQVEFNIRLYLTGTMRRLTDRIDNTGQKTPHRFVLNAMTELFSSLSDKDIEFDKT